MGAAGRRRTGIARFRVDERLRAEERPATLVMHRPPAHLDEEIVADVLDGPYGVVPDREQDGLDVQTTFHAESLEGR